jgi:phosphosulfolactate synthase
MDQTLQEYLGIQWPARSRKPRRDGVTMVMDTGWPTTFCESMLAQYGEYLDLVKLWDPHLRAPEKEIRRKIEAYAHYDVKVQPGGIFMEIARIQGCEKQVLKKMADIGFSVIEVSSTATTAQRDMQRESDFVKFAKDLGFTVLGEVGKKFIEGDTTRRSEKVVDEEVTVKEMLALLEAGASYVYWEGHLLRRVMGETAEELLESRNAGTQQVQRVAREVGPERIIFEVSPLREMVPRRTLQFWLVTLFGTEVNLGNVRLEELGFLEALRSGSHPVHGFGQAGDYPWIRAVETKRPADYPWWAEALQA